MSRIWIFSDENRILPHQTLVFAPGVNNDAEHDAAGVGEGVVDRGLAARDERLAKFEEDAEADHGKNEEPFWPALEDQHGVEAQDGVGKVVANFVVTV